METIIGYIQYIMDCEDCDTVNEFEEDPRGQNVRCEDCGTIFDTTNQTIDNAVEFDCECGEVFSEPTTGLSTVTCPSCNTTYRVIEER